jgi:hypothetical protein
MIMMNGTPPPAVRRDTESKNGTHRPSFFGALLAPETQQPLGGSPAPRDRRAQQRDDAAATPGGAVGTPTRGRHADIQQPVFFEERA